ncbi:MAG: nuclear transport factor 2 family protein [Myxococcota bacterium]
MAKLFGVLAACIFTASACAHSKIPGTEIDDTDENHEVLNVINAYTRAVESRDADAILAMVSPRYFEDNGNTDTRDDYDYKGLADTLKADFEHTSTIQLEVRVDDIKVKENTAEAYILYNVRGHADLPAGALWKTMTDRARMRFERQGNKWLILSGI